MFEGWEIGVGVVLCGVVSVCVYFFFLGMIVEMRIVEVYVGLSR